MPGRIQCRIDMYSDGAATGICFAAPDISEAEAEALQLEMLFHINQTFAELGKTPEEKAKLQKAADLVQEVGCSRYCISPTCEHRIGDAPGPVIDLLRALGIEVAPHVDPEPASKGHKWRRSWKRRNE